MKKITTEEFVRRSKEKHGTRYSYDKSVYVGAEKNITITCKIHGDFEQQANIHYMGFGCLNCSNNKKSDLSTFIIRAKAVHGDKYDYSEVNYSTNKTPVTIICKNHGEFQQRPDNHINKKNGCLKCKHSDMYSNTDDFIMKANKVHDNKFDYSKVEYINNKSKVTIICPVHGDYVQTPHGHLAGYGCIQCYSRQSKPEKEIAKFLLDNNINFISEQRFNDCKNVYTLPFDFYLPDLNMIIEYDGKHHFKAIESWGGEDTLKRVQNNDSIKSEYCKSNNIKLVRINYKQKLIEELNKLFK